VRTNLSIYMTESGLNGHILSAAQLSNRRLAKHMQTPPVCPAAFITPTLVILATQIAA
jgi:hypothetical protein